jgi:hypothetical protein
LVIFLYDLSGSVVVQVFAEKVHAGGGVARVEVSLTGTRQKFADVVEEVGPTA